MDRAINGFALAVDLLARREKDSIYLSIAVGIALSQLPAAYLVIAVEGLDYAVTDPASLWDFAPQSFRFALTGALIAILFWRIAICPLRRLRLAALRDAEAMREMK
ncbi:MAG TPA: hypothetical protein VFE34_01185 [Dongiaceae bacterium]|nr:hypothetical protein [Dongiaceae bacterium]